MDVNTIRDEAMARDFDIMKKNREAVYENGRLLPQYEKAYRKKADEFNSAIALYIRDTMMADLCYKDGDTWVLYCDKRAFKTVLSKHTAKLNLAVNNLNFRVFKDVVLEAKHEYIGKALPKFQKKCS